MLDEREITLAQLIVKLTEQFTLTVEEAIELTGYPRDVCYAFMEELVRSDLATWTSPVLGVIERNLFFTTKD